MATRKKKKVSKVKAAGNAGVEFNHAMVYVRDLAPARKFYAEQLGFKVIDEYPGAYLRLQAPKGKGTIALHMARPGEGLASDGVRLYFEMKDLAKSCAKLEQAGVVLSKQPAMMPWGWEHAYLNDPDGHEISLYWAGKKRFQKTVLKRGAGA